MMEAIPTLARALACGLVVWAVVKSVDDAPPPVAAWVISLPMTVGAAFIALAGTQPDAFVVDAARRAAQALPSMLAFVLVAARLFHRVTTPVLIGAALLAWLLAVAALTASARPWPLGISLLVGAALLAASHLVLPVRADLAPRRPARRARRAAWPVAVQAALMVVALSALASPLGPRFSAWLAALPMAMVFVTLGMKRAGSGNVAATYQSARFAMPGLFAYLAAVALLTPRVGGTAASLVSVLPSLALSALVVAGRHGLTPKEIAP